MARAVTPPNDSRRFDARFFMVDASWIQGEVHERPRGSGELLDLAWVGLDEARGLDLPEVTRLVIDEIGQRLTLGPDRSEQLPVPFYRWARGGPELVRLR